MLPSGAYISGSGPAIVFLHSSLSSSRQWQPLVKVLENKFTCINIDILGYGTAEAVADPENYDFSVETARINEVIEQTIGDAPYHLVGHSCGGAIALKLAVEAPTRLLSVSLFEPVAFHLLPTDSEERKISDEFAAHVSVSDNAKAAEYFTDFWNRKGFYLSLPEKMQALMAKDMPKVNLDFKGLISERYTLQDVANIKAPFLLMTGKYSQAISHKLVELIAGSVEHCRVESIPAGHMAPVSHAELVLPRFAEFITQN